MTKDDLKKQKSSLKEVDPKQSNLFTPQKDNGRPVSNQGQGILKTPGTVGANKNVSFAPGFNSTLSESQFEDDSPSRAASLRTADKRTNSSSKDNETLSNTTQNAKMPAEERTRLLIGVPGRFPSPWVSKTEDVHTNKDVNKKEDVVNDKGYPSKDVIDANSTGSVFRRPNFQDSINVGSTEEAAEFFSTLPKDPQGMAKWMYERVMEQDKQLSKLLERQFSAQRQGWLPWLLGRPAIDFKKEFDEMQKELAVARSFAKEKDKETSQYRAELADLTDHNTRMMESYEAELDALRKLNSKTHEYGEDSPLFREAEQLKVDLKHSREEIGYLLREKAGLAEQNKKLSNEIKDLQNGQKSDNNTMINTELEKLRGQISDLHGERRELKQRVSDLESELAAANQKLDDMSVRNRILTKKQHDYADQDTRKLRARIHELEEEMARQKNDADNRIAKLQKEADLSASEKLRAGNQMNSLKSEYEKEIQDLRENDAKSRVKLKTQIADLEQHVQLLTQQVRQKAATIEHLQNENSQLRDKLSAHTSSPRREIERLVKEKVAMQEKLQTMEQELKRFRTKDELTDRLVAEKMKLESSVRILGLENSSLKEKLSRKATGETHAFAPPTKSNLARHIHTSSTSSLESVVKESRISSQSSAPSKENIRPASASYMDYSKYQPSMPDITMRDASMESSRSVYREMTSEQKALSLRRLQEKRQAGLLDVSRMSLGE